MEQQHNNTFFFFDFISVLWCEPLSALPSFSEALCKR